MKKITYRKKVLFLAKYWGGHGPLAPPFPWPMSLATGYIQTKISFSLLTNSALLCIRGSRAFKRDIPTTDIEQASILSNIRQFH